MMLTILSGSGLASQLGLSEDGGFWLAVVLIGLGLLFDLKMVLALRDRLARGESGLGQTELTLMVLGGLLFAAGMLLLVL